MPSKRYKKASALVDSSKAYNLKSAVETLSKLPRAKFNETVEVAFRLGVDPKHPFAFVDHMRRITKPNGIIILSSGNIDAITWHLMGSRYWYCTIAEHIAFISPRWCEWVAGNIGIAIEETLIFAHENGGLSKRMIELGKNLGYKMLPQFVGWIRALGAGEKNASLCPELKDHPPGWGTAKDHMIVKFRTTT